MRSREKLNYDGTINIPAFNKGPLISLLISLQPFFVLYVNLDKNGVYGDKKAR